MQGRFSNRWHSSADDPQLMDAYDAMKRGNMSDADYEILVDYAHRYAYKKAIEKGLPPEKAEEIAEEASFRLIQAILQCRLRVDDDVHD